MAPNLEMSSLLKVSPGIKPRFFNQKIEAKEPEKNIPCFQTIDLSSREEKATMTSTLAKATILSA